MGLPFGHASRGDDPGHSGVDFGQTLSPGAGSSHDTASG